MIALKSQTLKLEQRIGDLEEDLKESHARAAYSEKLLWARGI